MPTKWVCSSNINKKPIDDYLNNMRVLFRWWSYRNSEELFVCGIVNTEIMKKLTKTTDSFFHL